jgi:hypothetical protein
MEVGKSIIVDVNSGGNYPLVVRVLGRETVDVPAGEHRGEARSAEGIRDITTREDARLRRELVEVRRADRLRAHEAVIKPRMVVRDDHEDVRAIGGGQRQAQAGEHGDAKG